jgi:hypothetical protein
MKKIVERINAKLALLQHLQGEGLLNSDIAPAAKAKLGADLVDAMKGEPVQTLLDELVKRRDRLTARRFEEGDEVSFHWRGNITRATVISCHGDHTRLRSSEASLFNTADLTPTELDDLNQSIAACSVLLMS